MSSDWGTFDFATLPSERKKWCGICEAWHVPPHDCLKNLKARAEAAEKQLAEVQERRAELERIVDIRETLGSRLAEAQQRIVELEKLVPVPSFLEAVADALGLSSGDEWKEMRKELNLLAAAIRKYREEGK